MQRILILESGDAARRELAALLASAGYLVSAAGDTKAASRELDDDPQDLLLLGNGDAGDDALALLRRWPEGGGTDPLGGQPGCPLILLIDGAGEAERVAGLRAGADDVLGRPFADEELLARIEAVLRRCRRAPARKAEPSFDCSGLTLDPHRLQVLAGDQPVQLGPTEFRLLSLFMSNPERALSRTQILERVWRRNTCVDERTVDAHVRRLRRALQDTGYDGLIQTVRGVGYRFAGDVGGASAANAPGPVRG
jgi:two-component system, OmpR family, phosphate regulon response regulator PhoB